MCTVLSMGAAATYIFAVRRWLIYLHSAPPRSLIKQKTKILPVGRGTTILTVQTMTESAFCKTEALLRSSNRQSLLPRMADMEIIRGVLQSQKLWIFPIYPEMPTCTYIAAAGIQMTISALQKSIFLKGETNENQICKRA